ncbi:hypothetical protein CC80DRAFT_420529, partial [Byssothecium circinans]
QRLLNEATALQFIKQNTTIPVPTFMSCERDEHGAMHLVVERIKGITASEVGQECRKPQGEAHVDAGQCTKCEEIVAKKVNEFVETKVIPELHKLRHNETGLNGFVLPHQRVLDHDGRDEWRPKSSPCDEYVFRHGDLARHNIMVDAGLDVVAIVDWETAGFYPESWEHRLWELDREGYLNTFTDTLGIEGDIKLIT